MGSSSVLLLCRKVDEAILLSVCLLVRYIIFFEDIIMEELTFILC